MSAELTPWFVPTITRKVNKIVQKKRKCKNSVTNVLEQAIEKALLLEGCQAKRRHEPKKSGKM